MNVDDGRIRLWRDLSAEEKESGRWVKLGDDEFACAATIDEKNRADQLQAIFADVRKVSLEEQSQAMRRAFSGSTETGMQK